MVSVSKHGNKWLVVVDTKLWGWSENLDEAEAGMVVHAGDIELCREPTHGYYLFPIELCKSPKCTLKSVHES